MKRKIETMEVSSSRFYQHTYDGEDKLIYSNLYETKEDGVYWIESTFFEDDQDGRKIESPLVFIECLHYPFVDTTVTVWSRLTSYVSRTSILRKYQVHAVAPVTYEFQGQVLDCYKYEWTLQMGQQSMEDTLISELRIDSAVTKGWSIYSPKFGIVEGESILNGDVRKRKLTQIEVKK